MDTLAKQCRKRVDGRTDTQQRTALARQSCKLFKLTGLTPPKCALLSDLERGLVQKLVLQECTQNTSRNA